jgi:hypothetical protein
MPLVEGKDVSPDDAMAKGLCPECGADLTKTNPIAHFRSHWKVRPKQDRDGEEGLRRMAMFQQFITDHDVRTTNMPKPKAPAAPAAPAPLVA